MALTFKFVNRRYNDASDCVYGGEDLLPVNSNGDMELGEVNAQGIQIVPGYKKGIFSKAKRLLLLRVNRWDVEKVKKVIESQKIQCYSFDEGEFSHSYILCNVMGNEFKLKECIGDLGSVGYGLRVRLDGGVELSANLYDHVLFAAPRVYNSQTSDMRAVVPNLDYSSIVEMEYHKGCKGKGTFGAFKQALLDLDAYWSENPTMEKYLDKIKLVRKNIGDQEWKEKVAKEKAIKLAAAKKIQEDPSAVAKIFQDGFFDGISESLGGEKLDDWGDPSTQYIDKDGIALAYKKLYPHTWKNELAEAKAMQTKPKKKPAPQIFDSISLLEI